MPVNLMLHCGGNAVEEDYLRQVKTPEASDNWFPIAHDQFFDGVKSSLETTGLQVVNTVHALARNDNRYFGLMEISSPHNDHSTIIGLRNSHDQSFSASLVLGSGVFVCDNLCFSGEVKVARKHTKFITRDLPQLLHKATGKLTDIEANQERRIVAYKEHGLSETEADHLMMEFLRTRIVPPSKALKVYGEYKNPQYKEHTDYRNSLWGLFNAVTEHTKGSISDAPRRGQLLHGICDTAAGVTLEGHYEVIAESRAAA